MLLEASRPKTLIASVCPVGLGYAMALPFGISSLTFLITVLTAMFIQIGTNFANDYFDFKQGADTEERKGPRRVTQAGLVSLGQMKRNIFIVFGVVILFSLYLIYLGGWPILTLTLIAIACGIFYTATPFSIAYLGLGELFVLIFFGMVATGATFYLQTGAFAWGPCLMGLAPGMFSVALIAINNLRDIEEDSKAGKNTLAVRFGERFGRLEIITALLLAHLIPLTQVIYHPYLALLLLPMGLLFFIVKPLYIYTDRRELNQTMGMIGQLFIVYTLILIFGMSR